MPSKAEVFATSRVLFHRNFDDASRLPCWGTSEDMTMTLKMIALAATFALSSTLAFAQPSQGKAGSDNGPTSNAPTTSGSMNQGPTAGTEMKNSTSGATTSSTPSGKDASTQGAGTAGAAQKKGDATTPGGTMKQ